MMNDGNETINFRISGTEFNTENGYNLKYVLSALQSINSSVEKTYTYLEQKERFTTADENNLKIKMTNIQPGSFMADLIICVKDIALPLIPMIAEQNPTQIWTLITGCYKYLTQIFTAKQKGESPRVETNNSKNTINVTDNSGTVNVYPMMTPELARELAPQFFQMNNLVAGDDRVSKIEVRSSNDENNKIVADKESKKLFKKTTSIDRDIVYINGTIIKVDAEKYKGTIEVTEAVENVKPGRYNYSFVDQDSIEIDELRSLLKSPRMYSCLKKVSYDPQNLSETVNELIIIKVEDEEAA